MPAGAGLEGVIAVFARAGGFDPRVEREKVGLEGNIVDQTGDMIDLVRRGLDAGHRLLRLPHHCHAFDNA